VARGNGKRGVETAICFVMSASLQLSALRIRPFLTPGACRVRCGDLPIEPFPCRECVFVRAPETPLRALWAKGLFHLPHIHVRRTLEMLSTLDTVPILNAGRGIAVQARSYDRHAQVEDPVQIQAIVDCKRTAVRTLPPIASVARLPARDGVIDYGSVL
jgi:hypothetical protein